MIKLLEVFGESAGLTSIVVSLLTGLTLGAGPLASAIADRYGCRATTIAGALLAATGCAISAWATGIYYLIFSVGIVMGLGFGLMYCPAIVIVTMYFERRRALATGIAVCGAGFGTLIFSVTAPYLINTFTWRGAFIVYAGLILICALCGALFRPLQFEAVYEEDEKAEERGREMAAIKEEEGEQPESERLLENGTGEPLRSAYSHSAVFVPMTRVQRTLSSASEYANGKGKGKERRTSTISGSTGYLHIKDVFYSGSITALDEYQPVKHRSILSLNKTMITDMKDQSNEKTTHGDEEGEESVLRRMVDVTLLSDRLFILFIVSNFLTSVGFNAPLIFLPEYAKTLNIPESQASYALGAFGITNTAGRVLIGLISDRRLPLVRDSARSRLLIYGCSLTICGTITCMAFLCTSLSTLIIYAALFGMTISSYVCLTSVLLVDFLGLDRLTNAFGLLLLFQGIATLIGPPCAGALADWTGRRYEWSFVFAGVGLLTSGLMMFAAPLFPSSAPPLTKRAMGNAPTILH